MEIIIALRIIGTALLAMKLIGINKNTIIKKCVGKSLIIDSNKNAYTMKKHYLEMHNENDYATIGISYIIISENINVFFNDYLMANKCMTILLSVLLASLLLLIAKVIVALVTRYIDKKEKDMIMIDNSLIEDGAVAIELVDEEE